MGQSHPSSSAPVGQEGAGSHSSALGSPGGFLLKQHVEGTIPSAAGDAAKPLADTQVRASKC